MKLQVNIFSDLQLRKRFLTGSLLVLMSVCSFAQANLQAITQAIKHGDAKSLSIHFDKTIDLTFSDKTNSYSKKQAELIIQKFFSKVEPTNFINVQIGNSNSNNTQFTLGNMTSSNGMYKVYMFFIQRNGTYVLRELRFEK